MPDFRGRLNMSLRLQMWLSSGSCVTLSSPSYLPPPQRSPITPMTTTVMSPGQYGTLVACWEWQNERDNKSLLPSSRQKGEWEGKGILGLSPFLIKNAGEDNCVRMGGLGCVGGKGAWLRMARTEERSAPPPQSQRRKSAWRWDKHKEYVITYRSQSEVTS